jgi:hypothetical protein
MMLCRLQNAVDASLGEEQAGFRPHRSCIDHIFSLRKIIEDSIEFHHPLIINFVDFEKAFDSLHRPSLWKILQHHGFPIKLINVIKAFYINSQCCVLTDSVKPEWFKVETGVKQGCIMSPLLFCIAID